jgi:hypothetical protein
MLLPKIIGYRKMNSGKRINLLRRTPGYPAWERNDGACPAGPRGEDIIRVEKELSGVREYFRINPSRWQDDTEASFEYPFSD